VRAAQLVLMVAMKLVLVEALVTTLVEQAA
jgi:hypothetical protein